MDHAHIKESRRHLAKLDSEHRIAIINSDLWVETPQISRIRKVVRNMLCVEGRSQAPCLLVCGSGGTGKTSIVRKLKSSSDKWGLRVGFTSLSENPEGLRFREQILLSLGVPAKVYGYRAIPQGVDKFIQLRGFRGLVIDEFHEFLLTQRMEQRKNLSLLKTLSGDPFGLSLIGFGTAGALNALQQDRQLERRFEIIQLLPWDESDDFRRFLASVEENMPLRKPSDLYEKDSVQFLLSETDGSMDGVMKMIRFGAIQAVLSGEEKITIDCMRRGAMSRWEF